MSDQIDLASLRKEYSSAQLSRLSVDPDPVEQFRRWFDEATSCDLEEANAMALATSGLDGRPSVRMVLLKGVTEGGFEFFTNLESRKARELAANPYVSAVFWWPELERQVRIEGMVVPLDETAADEYFATRPRGSRLGAWASRQSEVIRSRANLEERVERLAEQFPDEVPRPAFWGGYRIKPYTIEFWQGRQDRLHDRIRYRLDADVWTIERLSP